MYITFLNERKQVHSVTRRILDTKPEAYGKISTKKEQEGYRQKAFGTDPNSKKNYVTSSPRKEAADNLLKKVPGTVAAIAASNNIAHKANDDYQASKKNKEAPIDEKSRKKAEKFFEIKDKKQKDLSNLSKAVNSIPIPNKEKGNFSVESKEYTAINNKKELPKYKRVYVSKSQTVKYKGYEGSFHEGSRKAKNKDLKTLEREPNKNKKTGEFVDNVKDSNGVTVRAKAEKMFPNEKRKEEK